MKDNLIAARSLTEVAIFFGALTPHINVTRATNPYPKLLPLSTHSKQAVFRFGIQAVLVVCQLMHLRAALDFVLRSHRL